MTKVEEIANAMATASGHSMFDDLRPYMQERFRWMALAALKVMREPSEGAAVEATTAALLILAHLNVTPDVQDLLIQGNPDRGVPPGVLKRALEAARQAAIDAAIAEHEGRE